MCFHSQQEFWAWELRIFRVFFSNLTEVSIFLENVKKNGAITSSVFFRNYRDFFLAIFDKNTGHRVTKIHPVYRIKKTYNFYLMIFYLTWIFLLPFYIHNFGLNIQRRWDRVVGRALDGEFKIPSSSPAADNFFCFFYFPHLRKAKKLHILLRKYYINYRYNRHFAEGLRPPHLWQMNSNYGLLSSFYLKNVSKNIFFQIFFWLCGGGAVWSGLEDERTRRKMWTFYFTAVSLLLCHRFCPELHPLRQGASLWFKYSRNMLKNIFNHSQPPESPYTRRKKVIF